MTDDEDPEVAAVVDRELELLDPRVRRSRSACLDLIDAEFREFGVSGRVWDRESIIVMMAADEQYEPPATDDVRGVRLAPEIIQVTYRTRRPQRTTFRSSIWRRGADGQWRVMFHQGTVIPFDE